MYSDKVAIKPFFFAYIFLLSFLICICAFGEEQERKPSPLPFHNIEGSGGLGLTTTAYLANPSCGGKVLGCPSVSTTYATLGQKDVAVFAVTESLWERIELGYAHQIFHMGTLPGAIQDATGIKIGRHHINQDVFHAKFLLIEENSLDKDWIPAISFEFDYKMNSDIEDIDTKLGGALTAIGFDQDDGLDYLLVASKTFKDVLPQPFLASAGLRFTQGAQTGFLGFDNAYKMVVELNFAYFITDWWAVGAEYRQKPDEYGRIPGLVGEENDWWDICTAFIINPNLTLKAAYVDFGVLADTKEDAGFVFGVKYNF